MRGIDVARVVLLVGYKFNPILFVRNNVTETVALCVFGQGCRGENTVCPLLEHLLILSEDPLLFQLQLKGLTLRQRGRERERRGALVIEFQATHHSEVFLSVHQRGFYSFTFHHTRDYSDQRIPDISL